MIEDDEEITIISQEIKNSVEVFISTFTFTNDPMTIKNLELFYS